MRRKAGVVAIVLGLSVAAAPAWAGTCQVAKIVELPVTMTGRRPVVTAQINGRDARFILDSGAFFSTIARANALEYGLSIRAMPGATLRGIGGETSMQAATAKEFGIAGHTIKSVDFVVGGSDTGYAGLLGQNLLGLADAEYDLPHGAVRLAKTEDCRNVATLAYWAGPKPVAMLPIEPMENARRHTIGDVTVNGVRMKAVFDTGAPSLMLTLSAAKRIGLTPDSPGVTPSGAASGLGTHLVRTWRARLDSIDIGGETIPHPWVEIADQSLPSGDILIGVDFFLTHHIYVDNQSHRMFITYEGGPFFGLNPKRAVDDRGTAIDLTDTTGEPTDAAGYARRGAILASQQKFELAIADFDKAIALDPAKAHYVYQRAMARLANRQPLLGAADLDKAIALMPNDADARLARARLRLGSRDPSGALEDLKAADAALAPSADARQRLANLYNSAEAYEPALANYDLWLRSHPEDHDRGPAMNGRCWARAAMNRELDKALSDCEAALRLRPGDPAALDSRALVWLRRGEFEKALADLDVLVKAQPRNAWPLYVRSLAERRVGKAAQADADRAAALAINPNVAVRAKRFGLES